MNWREILVSSLLATAWATASPAQGLKDPDAIDTIVGSEVKEEEASAAADAEKLIAAIEKTPEAIEGVRKSTSLDEVEIVFLADAAEGGPPPAIEKKLEERKDEIELLREEINGSAMFFHAINSRSILLRDVLAVEFDSPNKAVIYAAAKPAK